MSLGDFIRGELLEVIEWTDDSRDTLAWRFPDEDRAIKNGARLIVRESQRAQFVYLGQFGDTFGPGQHALTTDNIPVLTRLASWQFGFDSPFKADVYFVNVRLFTGNTWGTTHPIMLHDDTLGIVRARAFGTFDFRVADVPRFLRDVAGSDRDFTLDEFEATMRSRLVALFADALAAARLPVADVAGRYRELGAALLPVVNAVTKKQYGIEVTSFVLENVSVPAEVEAAIDARGGMSSIGNLNDYVKFQMAHGMAQGQGSSGMAAELAVGLSVARQMMQQGGLVTGAAGAPGLPELLAPDDVAKATGVPEADIRAAIASGALPAKQIGESLRVTRAALQAYLSQ